MTLSRSFPESGIQSDYTLSSLDWRLPDAPPRRAGRTEVWTGTCVIVWGGFDEKRRFNSNDGSVYDPFGKTWRAISTDGAPTGRRNHTAVWTGKHMIIWGGEGEIDNHRDGAKYDLSSDNWTSMTTELAPAARSHHTALWIGTRMIVWGGWQKSDGGLYDPTTNMWSPVTSFGAPQPRINHSATWTGNHLIVWGGTSGLGGKGPYNDGGVYNPTRNTWTAITTTRAPSARLSHAAVWTGTRLLVWGGWDGSKLFNDGATYDPTIDLWTPISSEGAPSPRVSPRAVWTGARLIVWSGYDGGGRWFRDGGVYRRRTIEE